MLTEKDLLQINNKGINHETVLDQIKNFKKGFPFMDIKKAATIGNGMLKLDESSNFDELFEKNLNNFKIMKFVPASGAASRMFKDLFDFIDHFSGSETSIRAYFSTSEKPLRKFFDNINKFAFYNELNQKVKETVNKEIPEAIQKLEYKAILQQLLNEKAMNYGNLPKGLLKFHKYENYSRTPAEEHIVEAANYSTSNGKAYIHFTVSPEHKSAFTDHINNVLPDYEKKFNIDFDVTYSIQKPSTDTIAVDIDNNPFRNSDGSLIFRPGGHGALIENLNDINADIIFVKNIDNVVPDKLKPETIAYKKIIGGVLIYFKEKIFNYLEKIEAEINNNIISEIEEFITKEICIIFPKAYYNLSLSEKGEYLKNKLNRPIRVCGMVKNEGEPGGGPFWAENPDDSVSLHVVEMSQIDSKDVDKMEIVINATHFNPVDLVCFVTDYKGNKFDLKQYIDFQTGFISIKSKDGKDLKAQELPGLWNGAMSDWNTIFVEVPIITFNHVKEVNDLLRENHQ
jgi:hypothetical protein